jgi:hypothetical protein
MTVALRAASWKGLVKSYASYMLGSSSGRRNGSTTGYSEMAGEYSSSRQGSYGDEHE